MARKPPQRRRRRKPDTQELTSGQWDGIRQQWASEAEHHSPYENKFARIHCRDLIDGTGDLINLWLQK